MCINTISFVQVIEKRGETQMTERKLVGTNEMFKKALAGGYAIGAYNLSLIHI